MHSRWWRPNKVVDVWLVPPRESSRAPIRVPEDAWSTVAHAESWEEAIRMIRDVE